MKKKCRDFPGDPVVKFHASIAGGTSFFPGQGTKFHMLQLNILCAATETGDS